VSEGLATYYQNVLRARSGRLSAQQAWSELDSGFLRGSKEATDLTLAEATERMYRSGLFMKVYWSGTAIMLMADLHLRQLSNGTQSLDTALAALGGCCLDSPREWDGAELFAKLDALTGTTVFTSLLDKYVNSTQFPDLSSAYRELGLMPAVDGVSLVADAPFANLRDAIMSGGAPGRIHALLRDSD
jgi:predicted metalloprotease with PDZ domain